MRIHYSIKSFLAIVTLFAFGCGGLVSPGPIWAASFYTGAFLMILGGVTAAALRSGIARAYWIGFTLFGAGYFLMAMLEESHDQQQAAHVQQEPSLITTYFLLRANASLSMLGARVPVGGAPPVPSSDVVRIGSKLYSTRDDAENFTRIGNALFSLFFALAGGELGMRCYARNGPAALP